MLKRTVCVLLSLTLMVCFMPAAFAEDKTYTAITADDQLTASGTQLVNKNGDQVVLRGINLGGWTMFEDWISPVNSTKGCREALDELNSRLGEDQTHELMKEFMANWITEKDFDNIKDAGFNCVRIPIWYRNFQSDDKGTWYRDADGNIDFSLLDWAVKECSDHGLYAIIDLHGVPGYQNNSDHSGLANSCTFFDPLSAKSAQYRDLMVEFWKTIADRYKDDPAVAAYDLLNEPLCDFSLRTTLIYQKALWDYYDRLYDAVRSVDNTHIVCMEGIWRYTNLPKPEEYGWTNVMYQLHLYDKTNAAMCKAVNDTMNSGYNVPCFVGEFYPNGKSSFDYVLSDFNLYNISWCIWTYKGANSWGASAWWFLYWTNKLEAVDIYNDSYETIKLKWGDCVKTDSGNFEDTGLTGFLDQYIGGYVNTDVLATVKASTDNTVWQIFINALKDMIAWIESLFQKMTAVFHP